MEEFAAVTGESCSRQYRATSTWSPLWKQQGIGNKPTNCWERFGVSENPGEKESKGILFNYITALSLCANWVDLWEHRLHHMWAMNEYANLPKIILRLVLFCSTKDHYKRCLVFPMSYNPGG